MKASVCIQTYNHAPYIAKAIDSVLIQETDFDFEIIIGEDDSSDGTRDIVRAFKEKYPDKIRLLLNDRKNVIYVDGKPTGRWNFLNNLKNAQGEYVALLDGDDYWLDTQKLQKQVDYLDSHPDHVICFTSAKEVYDDESKAPYDKRPRVVKRSYRLEDILVENFIHTSTTMFRNGLVREFPSWFYQLPFGDWPLHVLNTQHGLIGFLDDVTGAYRRHNHGAWQHLGRVSRIEKTLRCQEVFLNYLGPEYEELLTPPLFKRGSELLTEYLGKPISCVDVSAIRILLYDPWTIHSEDLIIRGLRLVKLLLQAAAEKEKPVLLDVLKKEAATSLRIQAMHQTPINKGLGFALLMTSWQLDPGYYSSTEGMKSVVSISCRLLLPNKLRKTMRHLFHNVRQKVSG